MCSTSHNLRWIGGIQEDAWMAAGMTIRPLFGGPERDGFAFHQTLYVADHCASKRLCRTRMHICKGHSQSTCEQELCALRYGDAVNLYMMRDPTLVIMSLERCWQYKKQPTTCFFFKVLFSRALMGRIKLNRVVFCAFRVFLFVVKI